MPGTHAPSPALLGRDEHLPRLSAVRAGGQALATRDKATNPEEA
ncbi:hypothetical protein [Nocardia asteroides]